jgi:hypothetical protein
MALPLLEREQWSAQVWPLLEGDEWCGEWQTEEVEET